MLPHAVSRPAPRALFLGCQVDQRSQYETRVIVTRPVHQTVCVCIYICILYSISFICVYGSLTAVLGIWDYNISSAILGIGDHNIGLHAGHTRSQLSVSSTWSHRVIAAIPYMHQGFDMVLLSVISFKLYMGVLIMVVSF